MSQQQYRLVTRSDFDGLVCAVLLNELGMVNDIKFVHPKDMQDGKIEITERDITTNLPYVPGAYLAFDHHFSETLRNEQAETLFRMKGILAVQGQSQRYVLQGVHSLIDFRATQPWGSEARSSKIVFIGRDLDRAALQDGFNACLAA